MTIGSYPDVSLERAVTPILALIDIGHSLRTEEAPSFAAFTVRSCINALADQVIDWLQNSPPQDGKSWGYIQEAQTNLGVVKTLVRSLKDEDFSYAKDELLAIDAGIERLAQLAAKNLNAAGMGMNQSAAYRATYNAKNMKAATIHKRACELAKDGKVAGKGSKPASRTCLGRRLAASAGSP